MSITVIVSFQVANFDDWKAGFDSDVSVREEANINATAYKELDDPNRAHVIATVPFKEDFEAFFSRPELQQRIQDSGVLGPPEICFWEEV